MRSPADVGRDEDGGERPVPLARPRLGLHVHAELVAGEGLYLLAEPEPIHLADEIYADLVPLLDGRRSIEQLFAALRGRHGPHAVYAALDRLRVRGVLMDGPPSPDPSHDAPAAARASAAAFWEAQGIGGAAARERLRGARVSVVALGGQVVSPWLEALRGLEVEIGEPGSLTLVLAEDYLDPALAAIDARARAEGRPWLLVRPAGVRPWLGPLFVPTRTGCWECLAQRLRGHRRLEAHLRRALGRPAGHPGAGALPSTLAAVCGLATTEVAKQLVLGRSALQGVVLTLDLATLERQEHVLVRRPQCPACGRPVTVDPRAPVRPSLDADLAAARPELGSEASGPTRSQGGGWRTSTPEDTAARLRHHVSPITGIIGRVEPRLPQHASVIPIYVTDHSFAQMDTERWFLREGFRKRSGGKGSTRAQALASALGESIERYCGVFQGDEPRLRASREELGSAAIHPNGCMGFSARQYVEREHWNAAGSKVRHVPEPFDDRQPLEWTPLWSLPDEAPRYLPTAYCYYGYPYDHGQEGGGRGAEPRIAVADSNGCAAGNTLFEAVLQGLFELVERDCVALWWYNRVRRPGVALESFEAPYLLELVEHYRSLERELWAIDITSDLGIPAFAAVSRRVDRPREDVILGFGAHLDPRVALVRAMTEVGQSLPSVPSPEQGPQARYRGDNLEAARWWSTATVASEPYLRPAADAPRRRLADHPRPRSGSLAAQLHHCVERLSMRGLTTLVLDQSRPDVELAVARVVVPGLRHFWPRFAPGRLYDVPVAQGWRATPSTETELNEHVIYF